VTYRPDIDGLRAVAVLAVLLFHFQVPFFAGGFTGVDVFFVVSGFLITSIIVHEIDGGRFSLIAFYGRRAKRILPAMLLVVAASLLAGYFLLDPEQYQALTRSGRFSVFGLANFYFLWNGGYFDQAVETQPLLHMWSLGVEEQFYLVWPLTLVALLLVLRFSRNRVAAIIGLAILASFALSVALVGTDQSRAFYLPLPRAWELGLGALLVFAPRLDASRLSEAAAVLGIAAIAYGIVALSGDSPFPGINALFPCLGTALIIWPRVTPTIVSSALAFAPTVFVGKISYSLYLWHWPLLVFFREYTGAAPSATETVAMFGVCFMLSVVSWRFVESPVRSMKLAPRAAIAAGLAAMSIAWLGAAEAAALRGRTQQSEVLRLASFHSYKGSPDYQYQYWMDCFVERTFSEAELNREKCVKIDPARANYLLLGDSHAAHLWRALSLEFPRVNLMQITATGCPLFDASSDATPCNRAWRFAFDTFLPKAEIDGVIFAGRWKRDDIAPLLRRISKLRQNGVRVIELGPTVEYNGSLPLIVAAEALGNKKLADKLRARKRGTLDRIMRARVEAAGATYVSVIAALCPAGSCETVTDGVPVSFDYAHFTLPGSLLVARRIREGTPSLFSADSPFQPPEVRLPAPKSAE
jgi:peptidoglycan/LPS O-acetylase OafA/YrhL